jgi:hypothetical protein
VLYHIDKNGTEFNEFTGEEEECTIRVLRTVYLLSRLAHIHAGELCLLNAHFKNLWIRMEKETQQKNVTPIMKELANIANEIPKDDT